jgi:hypothetical protein
VQSFDPHGKDTGIPWREPITSWIERLETTRRKPLETCLE